MGIYLKPETLINPELRLGIVGIKVGIVNKRRDKGMVKITEADWEKYLAELEALEKKYLTDRDAIRDRFTAKQKAQKEARE